VPLRRAFQAKNSVLHEHGPHSTSVPCGAFCVPVRTSAFGSCPAEAPGVSAVSFVFLLICLLKYLGI
jgi:hypothetical protein